MITLDEYYQNGKNAYASEWTYQIETNAIALLNRVNILLKYYGKGVEHNSAGTCVASGWRPPSYNNKVKGAALRSRHMSGEAIDIYDPEGEFDAWCLEHQEQLALCGLWMEHPSATKGWCHLQSVPPRSGNRVFYP